MRFLMLLAPLVLVACSAAFSLRVADFRVPIGNTLGRICWVKVDTSGAPRVRTASYRAQAVYDAELALSQGVTVRFYGRSVAPAGACTAGDEAVDRPLSEPIELERQRSQAVSIGGGAYATDLGSLVNAGVFWLGASAAGNVGIGEELLFESGRITVGF
jgi:hypothetical protein